MDRLARLAVGEMRLSHPLRKPSRLRTSLMLLALGAAVGCGSEKEPDLDVKPPEGMDLASPVAPSKKSKADVGGSADPAVQAPK